MLACVCHHSLILHLTPLVPVPAVKCRQEVSPICYSAHKASAGLGGASCTADFDLSLSEILTSEPLEGAARWCPWSIADPGAAGVLPGRWDFFLVNFRFYWISVTICHLCKLLRWRMVGLDAFPLWESLKQTPPHHSPPS